MTASFLDLRFVLVLCLIVLSRRIWPQRFYLQLGVLSSSLLLALAAPKTLIAISSITILLVLPLLMLNRSTDRLRLPTIAKKSLLPISIVIVVALLILFKVYRQFTVPWLGGAWLRENVLALVGFSYFIFRLIDYLHIQILTKPEKNKPWELLYYVLFPPTITSGPIQKYSDFHKQVANPQPFSASLVLNAGYRLTRGYFRKTVVAVLLDGAIKKFDAIVQPNGFISILTLFLLYLYFYYDFAGYSDIAIGFGLLLGIRVPENFRRPFRSTSISEFWRNWHITLVDWFRDHVFIPLGGMRGSRIHAASLAFFIMALCGIWHGLTLNFIIWGLWHGVNLFGEAMLGIRPIPPGLRKGPKYWVRVCWTNARVAAGCVFFLPDFQAISRILSGFTHWRW